MSIINKAQFKKINHAKSFLQNICNEYETDIVAETCKYGKDCKVSIYFCLFELGANECNEFAKILDDCSSMDLEVINEEYFKMTLTIPDVYEKE